MLLRKSRKTTGSTRRPRTQTINAIFYEKTKKLCWSVFETISGMRALSSLAHPLGWEMVRSEELVRICASPPKGYVVLRRKMSMRSSTGLIDDGFLLTGSTG